MSLWAQSLFWDMLNKTLKLFSISFFLSKSKEELPRVCSVSMQSAPPFLKSFGFRKPRWRLWKHRLQGFKTRLHTTGNNQRMNCTSSSDSGLYFMNMLMTYSEEVQYCAEMRPPIGSSCLSEQAIQACYEGETTHRGPNCVIYQAINKLFNAVK